LVKNRDLISNVREPKFIKFQVNVADAS